MKRIISLMVVAFAATTMLTSCGAKAPAAPAPGISQGTPELTEGNDVMEYAGMDPDRRAYGVGTHFQEATARRAAEANARAALAAAFQTMVKQSFDSFAGAVSATGSNDGIDSMLSEDQVSVMNEAITAISKETVTNTAVSKMQRYKNGNQFTIYVCMEHRLGMKELVEEITAKIAKNIPDEIKEEIQYDQYLHQKKMEDAFDEYKSVTN